MAKYSRVQFEGAFALADRVFSGLEAREEAAKQLSSEFGVAKGTGLILFECYRRLRHGVVYKRALSELATAVFLSEIERRFGLAALATAVRAADAHLTYRTGIGDQLTGLRKGVDGFRSKVLDTPLLLPGESSGNMIEGRRFSVVVDAVERDAKARNACISHYGLLCSVCSFDFGLNYGELGFGFIHVHHLEPLAQTDGVHDVDPVTDLRPVCPNCHAMLHRETPPVSIERLKAIVASHRPSVAP